MKQYRIIRGSVAEQLLVHDYEAILDRFSPQLTETEYEHLASFASIGYEHAAQKSDYLLSLQDTVLEWAAETQRAELHFVPMDIDFLDRYNKSSEVKEHMLSGHSFGNIPMFFACFGAVVLSLFCIFATILIIGIYQNSFPINPVYLLMFALGFLGLLCTDIVAIADWRKEQNGQTQ